MNTNKRKRKTGTWRLQISCALSCGRTSPPLEAVDVDGMDWAGIVFHSYLKRLARRELRPLGWLELAAPEGTKEHARPRYVWLCPTCWDEIANWRQAPGGRWADGTPIETPESWFKLLDLIGEDAKPTIDLALAYRRPLTNRPALKPMHEMLNDPLHFDYAKRLRLRTLKERIDEYAAMLQDEMVEENQKETEE